jgi:glycosyltransferase involved in cell wall biosynthesis
MVFTKTETVTIERSGQVPVDHGGALVSPVLAGQAKDVISPSPRIIVAIPAYNEEVAIGSIILKARKHASGVIVIDDGSTDNTAEIAKLAGALVISHVQNEGKGTGIRDAFSFAKRAGADILVLIDGDGQHNPGEIPGLIEPILNDEADFVNGSRFIGKEAGGNNVPLHRRLGQEVLTLATNAGTRKRVTDTQNGFRAFSKKTFDCFSFGEKGMAIESEMLIDASTAKMRLKEVPISVRYDVNGSTYNLFTHGFGVLNKVFHMVSKQRPILCYCLPGLVMVLLGAVFALMLMDGFNATHNLDVEYGLGSMLSIIPGVAIFSNGLMITTMKVVNKDE